MLDTYIDVLMKMNATQQMKNIQIKPAVPPLTSPMLETLYVKSQSYYSVSSDSMIHEPNDTLP